MNSFYKPMLILTAFPAMTLATGITLKDFTLEDLEDGKKRVAATANVGEDSRLGAFMLILDGAPDSYVPKGFFQHEGRTFLASTPTRHPDHYLIDNGPLDEDPAVGRFAYTLNTKGWKSGRYTFALAASNRPAPGRYIGDSQAFRIEVGEVPPLMVSNIPSARHHILYRKEEVYACFPSLYVFPDNEGKLGTSFGTKTNHEHVDPEGGSKAMISPDEGRTWHPADEPLINRRWVTKQGDLVRAKPEGWIYVNESEKGRLEEAGRPYMAVRPGTIGYLGGAVVKRSTDGGKSWDSESIDLPPDCLGLHSHHHTATQLVTFKGVRLNVVYGYRRGEPDSHEVYFLRSEDDGKTWNCFPMYPNPADTVEGFNETTIEQAADGTIIALMRSKTQDYLWQSESKDDGLTWSKAVKTPIWGVPAHLLRLKDGRLLCANGYRKDPMGIRVTLSHDNGRTWDMNNQIIIRGDGFGRPGDLGYPLAYERKDGSIFLIYYITTDTGNPHIATTEFMIEPPAPPRPHATGKNASR